MAKQRATTKQVVEVLRDNPSYNRAKIIHTLQRPVEHWQVQSAKRKLGLQKTSKPAKRRKGRRPVTSTVVTTNNDVLTAAELIIQAEKLCQNAGSVERVKRAIDVLSEVGEI